MALGAKRTDILRIVFQSTALTIGLGVIVGLALSLALDKLVATWVAESSHDPLILVTVIVLLTLSSALACFLPAQRAATVEPIEALRYE